MLKDIRDDCMEILAELELGDAQVGLKVRCSSQEETTIVYDRHAGQLSVDRSRSSLALADDAEVGKGTHVAPLALAPDEQLQLHVYLDRSVLEIFANERICITSRIYPTRPDSLGVDLVVHKGEAVLSSLDIWEMNAIW